MTATSEWVKVDKGILRLSGSIDRAEALKFMAERRSRTEQGLGMVEDTQSPVRKRAARKGTRTINKASQRRRLTSR